MIAGEPMAWQVMRLALANSVGRRSIVFSSPEDSLSGIITGFRPYTCLAESRYYVMTVIP